MDRMLLELFQKALDNPDETQLLTASIADTVTRADERAVKPFVARIKQMIKATSVSPSKKHRAFEILTKCMSPSSPSLIRVCESKILGRLAILAQHSKDRKDLSRGSTLFGNWSQMIEEAEASIRFFRLLLVSLRDWADRFVYVKPGVFSKYYRVYQKLLTMGVGFPTGEDVEEYAKLVRTLISLFETRSDNRVKIEELTERLPDMKKRLTHSFESETDPATKAAIEDCLQLISAAESLHKQREIEKITDKVQHAVECPYFIAIPEPAPMEEPDRTGEERNIMDSEGDEDDLERSVWDLEGDGKEGKMKELDAELRVVELTLECNRYKEEMRKLESKNRRLESIVESLQQDLVSERTRGQEYFSELRVLRESSARLSLSSGLAETHQPPIQYPIANKASFQLLSNQAKGTLYSDKYCELLISLKLENNDLECNGAFMLVLRSTVREVLETVMFETVATPGFVCKPAKDLEKTELLQNHCSNAQFRFRYTEITPVAPVISMSFVSGGLQFLYHFKLPVPMLRFGRGLGGDLQTMITLWNELKEFTSETTLTAFDPLIQNTTHLADRIRFAGQMCVFFGPPLPSGCVMGGSILLNETVLIRLTVTPSRHLQIEVVGKSPKIRGMTVHVVTQMVEA